jgi:hypothetical protein
MSTEQRSFWAGSLAQGSVEFRAVGQAQQGVLHDLVISALGREHEPGVLVFDARPTFLASLARDLTVLGRRVVLAMTAIEVIRYLR